MTNDNAIVVEDVSKRFRLYRERNQSLKAALMRGKRARFDEFWALKDVSFEIPTGSTFGLVGENGSGKSTLLKCIAKILTPDTGSIRSVGSLAALLELGSGFHPEMSGRENVYLNGAILGMRKSEIERKFDAIVDFAGIETFIDQPVKNYSSGMYVRLGFSVAINIDPDVLLVDEVLAVGDQMFQEKCMEKFAEFRRAGKTVVIVSHAMGSMRTLCDKVAWLEHGRLLDVGDAGAIVDKYVDDGHEERVELETGATRWGSGEVVLTNTELLDAEGRATTRFYPGDKVTLRTHFSTTEPIDKPVFGFSIETLEGVYVWAHHSRDGNMVPDRLEGEGYVDLVFDSLRLQAGTFDLNVSVADYTTTHTYDFLRGAKRFDVLMRAPHESGGLVELGGHWQQPRYEGPKQTL
ncbi:ABC-2 type transport system ATP-binding protein [Jatrophihabitans sp. GAS493]|uniref:ABC transporter ATP-binding protein n=1 Tax=Jatrophihabitans sp. GAS493 TaxID=1907575 RepID=UPI000BB6B6F7|nr:ABC transporter ATP-binding protein [Jatrophihabitans sp. GAS493]SOD70602.1 ABC-2 type transport system ATP-binding protein [Jatrophihabitans sp. GAS493]